jgi:predicted DCC family thiol-disulfide oxidoreductase YuxK
MSARSPALWVLYDDTCGFCCRCADFLRGADKLLPLTCLPRGGHVAQMTFTGLTQSGDELVVVDSNGGVYRGGDAFVMALWALTAFRPWAQKAAREPLRSRARSLFHWLSSRRFTVSARFRLEPEATVAREIDRQPQPTGCVEGQCQLPLS